MAKWQFCTCLLLFLIEADIGFEINSEICGIPQFNPSISSRIVNGSTAGEGSWPWMVLIMENNVHICGGTLISEEWILTVAHCMIERDKDAKSSRIYVGAQRNDASDENALEVKIQAILCHKDYKSSNFKHDICLIRLAEPVIFNKHIIPVCLPTKGSNIEVGSSCIVTGWGQTLGTGSDYFLRQAEVFVLDIEECRTWYDEASTTIPENHFCAGHKQGLIDTCQGDSGGPLVHKEIVQNSGQSAYVLRGMTSFGEGCAVAKRPGVYVKVVDYLDWIEDNMLTMAGNSCMAIQNNSCGRIVENSGVIIRNPTDTGSYFYPPNSNCSWKIIAPEGYYIHFKFICYFLMPSRRGQCEDYITISGLNGNDQLKLCGNQLPDTYIVENNTALFQFISNEKYENSGFIVEINFIMSNIIYNTTVFETSSVTSSGSITSPTFAATTTSDVTSIKIFYTHVLLLLFIAFLSHYELVQ